MDPTIEAYLRQAAEEAVARLKRMEELEALQTALSAQQKAAQEEWQALAMAEPSRAARAALELLRSEGLRP